MILQRRRRMSDPGEFYTAWAKMVTPMIEELTLRRGTEPPSPEHKKIASWKCGSFDEALAWFEQLQERREGT